MKNAKIQKARSAVSLTCSAVVGDVVSGQVRASSHVGVIVAVEGTVGRLRLSDISTRFISGEEVAKMYPVGGKISDLVVTAITADKKLELKLKSKIGEPTVGSIHKVVVKRVEKYGVLLGFSNSMMRCLCETEEVADEDCKVELAKIQPGHKFNVKVIRVTNGKVWVTMKKSQLGESSTEAQPLMDEEIAVPTELPQPVATLIDEDEEEETTPVVVAKRPLEDALETETPDAANRKKSKRQKDAVKRQVESELREKEESLLTGDWKQNPQSAEEFERLLIVDNAAAVWIKYMSFWLKLAELARAREVAERALKKIQTEEDKLSCWIAYLNMEAAFGSSTTVDALFVRAAQYCHAKTIYHALPQVWIRAQNWAKAQSALERMVAKFPECRKAWINLIEFFFDQKMFDEARTAFAKSIKSLPARKQNRTTVKFAQFEFRSGNPERGASVFETLVAGSAKTDSWSVYFDEMIRAGDMAATRALFERALSLKLKAFKTKFIFKRWLDFETKFGNDESVQAVKEKAVKYVEEHS